MTSPQEHEYLSWAQMIDHALLRPNMSTAELESGIDMAARYQVASVCILPYAVPLATRALANQRTRPSTTIGFPHGGQTIRSKEAEARAALDDGAQELDMVVNVSQVVSAEWGYVQREIAAVLAPVRVQGMRLKVIFETAYLTDQQKIALCRICDDLGVDWVKTSTGFAARGATPADVALMRAHVGPRVQVKAAGGIRTLDALKEMKRLGATRCGTSQTSTILEELRATLGLPQLSDALQVGAPAEGNY